MSTTIEQKITEMKLDNSNFESHAQQTIKTVNQLNESLKLNNATKGFANLESAVTKANKTLKATQTQMKKTAESFDSTYDNTKKAQKGFQNLQDTAEKAISNFSKISETFNKAMNFDPVSASVDKFRLTLSKTSPEAANSMMQMEQSLNTLTKKFDIAGITWQQIIRKSTDGLTSMVAQIAAVPANAISNILSLPFKAINQAVSGGWTRATNIDQAKHQLKGLGITWEDISDDINYAVADTAYGLDAAAQAASKLAASGVEFGKSFGDTGNSPMARALRGISGLAAMTNQSYERVAGIYSQVSAVGALMGQDLLQLNSLGGVNVTATIAKQLNKSQEEIQDMMSKRQLDFQTFADAMNDAFGEHAKSANETLEGSMANMKAALSRIGADFAAPIRKNAIPIFNDLKAKFAEIKKIFEDTGVYKTFEGVIEKIFIGFDNFVKAINLKGFKDLAVGVQRLYKILSTAFTGFVEFLDRSTGWLRRSVKQMLTAIDPITRLFSTVEKKMGIVNEIVEGVTGKFGSLVKAASEDGTESLTKGFGKLTRAIDRTSDVTKSFEMALNDAGISEEKLNEIAKRVIAGEYGEGQARIDALNEEYGFYDLIQKKVNELLKGSEFSDGLVDEDNANETKKNVSIISKSIGNLTANAKQSLEDMTNDDSLLNKTKKYGENIQNTIQRVVDTFGESIRVVKKFFYSLNSMFSDEDKIELLSNITDFVSSKFERLLHWVGVFNRVLDENGVDLMRIISRATKLVGKVLGFIGRLRKAIWNILDALGWSDIRVKLLGGTIKTINNVLGKLLKIVDPIFDKGIDGVNKIGEKLTNLRNGVIRFYEALKETEGFKRLVGIFDSIFNSAKSVFSFISGKFLGLGNKLSESLDLGIQFDGWEKAASDFGNFLNGAINKATNFKNAVVSGFNMALQAITSFLGIDISSYGFSDGTDSIIDTFNNIINMLTNNNVVKSIKGFFGDITTEGQFDFEKFKVALDKSLDNILSWLGERIKSAGKIIFDWFVNGGPIQVFRWVYDKLEELLAGFLPEDLVHGLFDLIDLIYQWIDKLREVLVNNIFTKETGSFISDLASNIGKGMSELAKALNPDNIKNAWEAFKAGLAGFSVVELINTLISGEHAPGIKASINNPFKDLGIADIASSVIDGAIGSFFGHNISASVLSAEELSDVLQNDKFTKASSTAATIAKQVGVDAASEAANDVLGNYTSGFTALIDIVTEKLEEFDLTDKFTYLQGQVQKIIGDIYDSENPLESIVKIVSEAILGSLAFSVVGILRDIKKSTGSIKKFFKASENIPTLFKSIEVSFKKGIDKTFANLTGIEKAIAKEHKAAKWDHLANTFLKIVAGIVLIIGAVAGIYFLIKDGDVKAFQQAAGIFMIVAGGIALLSLAVAAVMSAIAKFKEKGEGNTVVSGLNSTFTITEDIKEAIKKFLGKIGNGVMFVGLGVAIATIAGAFVKLAKLDIKQVGNGATALAAIAIAIAGVMAAILGLMNLLGKDKDKVEHFTLRDSLFIIALGAAISIAAGAFVKMGNLPVSGIDKGVEAFDKVISSMALIVAMTKNYEIKGSIGKRAGFSAGIDMEVKQSFLSIIGVILIMWTAANQLKKLSKLKPEKLELATTSLKAVFDRLIWVLVGITAYSTVEKFTNNALDVIAVITIVMGETYLLVMGLYNLASESERFTAVTNGISKIFATLGDLMNSIAMFSFSHGIAGLLPGGSTVKSVDDIIGFTAISVFITAVTLILDAVEGKEHRITNFIDRVYPILKKAASCIGKLIGIIVNKGILKPIAKTFGLGNLGEQIGSTIGDILDVLKQVFSPESETYDVSKAEAFAGTISRFAGIVNDMVSLGNDAKKLNKDDITNAVGRVTAIAEGLVDYSVAASKIDANKITEVTSAIEGIIKYVQNIQGIFKEELSAEAIYGKNAESLDKSSSFEYLNEFMTKLLDFADGLKQYSEKIKEVEVDDINATSAAVDTIIALSRKVPDMHTSDGSSVLGWILGSNDIAEFGPKLFPFARGMVYYSKAISNMDVGAVKKTKDACKTIMALANSVPDQHGFNEGWSVLGWILGSNDIAEFGPKLFPFARGMVYFSKTIKNLDVNAVDKTKAACQTIMELAQAVPPQEGLLGWILGDTSIENFGNSLRTFAAGMYSYSVVVGNTDFGPAISKTEDVREFLEAYASLLTSLDDVNLIWESVANFGIGHAAEVIDNLMRDINLEEVNKDSLYQIGAKMFTNIMEGFDEAVRNPKNVFDETKVNPLDNAMEIIIATFEDDLNTIASSDKMVQTFANFFGTAMESAADYLNKNAFGKLFAPASEVLNDEGTEGTGGIVSAVNKILAAIKILFDNNGAEIKKQLDDLVENITTSSDIMSANAYSSGKYVMIGLYNGLRDASKYPINAAQSIGQRVIAALNNGLTVASPAREAIKSGMFVDKGLEIGLTDNQNGLFAIAKNIGMSVISTLNNGIDSESINPFTKLLNWVRGAAGLFNDILNDAIDMNPVITPVLDMTSFERTRRSYQGFNIDGTAQLARTSMVRSNNFQNTQVTYDDSNVIKAINSMNQSVNVLGARLNKMQVVLDSGALVGELSGGIDARLGTMNKYGKRWA